ncbi:FliM/FliN family flagellar motor switch protein [Granulicella tundricola]|uniref:Flagellar motor switch protein FliN n=1 Tax=Granulicella tundricola (strain ATCC BAA-1859 / DSM 23138 / MP5ACTX9) TaxID=1198114 RepID=E8X625_GRATM|nr:FliM/FliN family flagellar motor switch protein [Granulicella tundricola]ADW70909.1 flagellar motor switch protein FliN [Granulicella tundricola MP5ACTX9]
MQAPEISSTKTLESLFCGALAKPFSDACTSTWHLALSTEPVPTAPALEDAVIFRCTFSGEVSGQGFALLRHAEVVTLGLQDMLDDTDAFGDEHAMALSSIFEASCNELCQHLSQKSPVTVQVERMSAPELPTDRLAELFLEAEGTKIRVSILLFFDQQLVTTYQNASAQTFSFPEVTGTSTSNLNLVLDVELNVTLRFGQRQLSLREVLDLTSGSVVELDRQVDEPVELVLDGKVVARGEAVIIDGNYGMRITQVLQQVTA